MRRPFPGLIPHVPNQTLTGVLEELESQTEDQDAVAVADLLDIFADRSFGPLLVVPALLGVTPLGMIPGVPTVLGLLVALVAAQRVVGLRRPWVPGILARRSIAREKLVSALDKGRRWSRRVDKLLKPRLGVLVEGPMEIVLGALALLVALLVPPLELVPFGAFVPFLTIIALGLAKVGRDGVLALVGIVLAGGALGLVAWTFLPL